MKKITDLILLVAFVVCLLSIFNNWPGYLILVSGLVVAGLSISAFLKNTANNRWEGLGYLLILGLSAFTDKFHKPFSTILELVSWVAFLALLIYSESKKKR